jgi:hypothetical protein
MHTQQNCLPQPGKPAAQDGLAKKRENGKSLMSHINAKFIQQLHILLG